jgi:hypothetical protein
MSTSKFPRLIDGVKFSKVCGFTQVRHFVNDGRIVQLDPANSDTDLRTTTY